MFRAELAKLTPSDRIRRIDYRLAEIRFALTTRGEKLLGLRGDFDALTIAFWKAFGRGLGCEDPEREIAAQMERMRSVGHILLIVLSVAMTVLAGVGAHAIPELVVFIAVVGTVALCLLIAAPYRQIARARELAVILGQEQEPFWLTAGNVALSNLGITAPSQAKWWWKDRVVFVFVRHLSVRFSIDAFTGERVWEDQVPGAGRSLSTSLASQILKDLLNDNPRYRQMVASFQGLAGLENDIVVLQDLKAEAEWDLATELREAEERAAKLRREAEELRAAQPQTSRSNAPEREVGSMEVVRNT